ncbi:hypothetical protein EYR40_009577 [Pleurotus pulmonarius]|nr:hypothetical protein EYR38_009326 [Pleurotus pulmonarius]KAF4590980.1 hypothetical protein EYR40_009577 [Pleurotus pulmonarius]
MFSASLSPIHRLPVELLSRIFVEGVNIDYPYAHSPFLFKPNQPTYREDDPTIRSPDFQLLVSHICKHWRDIALNTACLWNTIHFSSPKHLSRAREYIRRCLPPTDAKDRYKRSPIQLLDVMVDTVSPRECREGRDLCKDHFDDVFGIIMPYVELWRSFHLKVRDDACKALARKHLGNATGGAHLETLQLYHFEAFGDARDLYIATYRPPVIVFHNKLPKLRNVSLIGVNLNWSDSNFLHSLDHLQLALHADNIRPPFPHFAAMLQKSPQLKTLSLHYSGPKNSDDNPAHNWFPAIDTIILPSLTELALVDLDPGYLCAIIEHLIAPSLAELTLELSQDDEYPERDYTSFIDLIVKGREIQLSPISSHNFSSSSLVVNGTPPATSASPHPPQIVLPTPPATNLPSNLPPSHNPSGSHVSSDQHAPVTSNPNAPPPVRIIHIRPIPNLSNLKRLAILALDCDLESWRSLLRALAGLQTLEVDFERLSPSPPDREAQDSAGTNIGIESSERLKHSYALFRVLLEGEDNRVTGIDKAKEAQLPVSQGRQRTAPSTCSSLSSSAPNSRVHTPTPRLRTPLLPALREFKVSGVSASLLREFVVHREGGWLRQMTPSAAFHDASPRKIPPINSSSASHYHHHDIRKYALKRYVVRRSSGRVDEDLDRLIDGGCWVSATELPCLRRSLYSDDEPNERQNVDGWLIRLEEEEMPEEDMESEDEDEGTYDEQEGEQGPVRGALTGENLAEADDADEYGEDHQSYDDSEEDSDYAED